MANDPETRLTPPELQAFRRLAGFMVPASVQYRVPGADDEAIFADIVSSLGRDTGAVRQALSMLRELANGDFPELDEPAAEATAMALLERKRWRRRGGFHLGAEPGRPCDLAGLLRDARKQR